MERTERLRPSWSLEVRTKEPRQGTRSLVQTFRSSRTCALRLRSRMSIILGRGMSKRIRPGRPRLVHSSPRTWVSDHRKWQLCPQFRSLEFRPDRKAPLGVRQSFAILTTTAKRGLGFSPRPAIPLILVPWERLISCVQPSVLSRRRDIFSSAGSHASCSRLGPRQLPSSNSSRWQALDSSTPPALKALAITRTRELSPNDPPRGPRRRRPTVARRLGPEFATGRPAREVDSTSLGCLAVDR